MHTSKLSPKNQSSEIFKTLNNTVAYFQDEWLNLIAFFKTNSKNVSIKFELEIRDQNMRTVV